MLQLRLHTNKLLKKKKKRVGEQKINWELYFKENRNAQNSFWTWGIFLHLQYANPMHVLKHNQKPWWLSGLLGQLNEWPSSSPRFRLATNLPVTKTKISLQNHLDIVHKLCQQKCALNWRSQLCWVESVQWKVSWYHCVCLSGGKPDFS